MTHERRAANVLSTHYYLARASIRCWYCERTTTVVALGVPPGHQVLECAEMRIEADGPGPGDVWQRSDFNAFLFHVRDLNAAVRRRIQQASSCFRLARGDSTFDSCWANHCEHCGAMLEDHEIHCEPDVAFVMASESRARSVRVRRIGERLEAAADGYAPDPQFFDRMTAC